MRPLAYIRTFTICAALIVYTAILYLRQQSITHAFLLGVSVLLLGLCFIVLLFQRRMLKAAHRNIESRLCTVVLRRGQEILVDMFLRTLPARVFPGNANPRDAAKGLMTDLGLGDFAVRMLAAATTFEIVAGEKRIVCFELLLNASEHAQIAQSKGLTFLDRPPKRAKGADEDELTALVFRRIREQHDADLKRAEGLPAIPKVTRRTADLDQIVMDNRIFGGG